MSFLVQMHQVLDVGNVMVGETPPAISLGNGSWYSQPIQSFDMLIVSMAVQLLEGSGSNVGLVVEMIEAIGVHMINPRWWNTMHDEVINEPIHCKTLAMF